MTITIELILAFATFFGGLIGLYVKMQVDNAVTKAEIAALKESLDESKEDKKEFTKALMEMRNTLHQLDVSISSMKMIIKYKIAGKDDEVHP